MKIGIIMSFNLLILLSLILIFLAFFHFRPRRVIYLKNFSIVFLCVLFISCLILFSGTAVDAAKKGLNLCLNIVFPSLFPFFVGSELLYNTGIVKAIGILLEPVMRPLFNIPGCGSFPFAMGITSGYPIGAKLTVEMRQKEQLSKLEAERLIAFSNNSGPLFVIGAVGVGMYNLPRLGYFLLACHIAACITVGLLFRFYGRKNSTALRYNKYKLFPKFKEELKHCLVASQNNFGNILGNAVKNSVGLILSIGGFIIFFSVLINLLLETGVIDYFSAIISFFLSPLGIHKEIIPSLVSGFFEITTGSNLASKVVNIPFIQQITAGSIIIGWAGLSVHSQVLSIVSSSDISIKPYFFGKFLQGCIAGFYTYIIIKVVGSSFLGNKPAFNSFDYPVAQNWNNYFLTASKSFIFCIISLCIVALLIHLVRKLK